MRDLLQAALLLAATGSAGAFAAPASEPIANVTGRRQIDLNGDWRIIVDPYNHGGLDYRARPRADGFFKDAKPKSPSDLVEYDFDTSPVLKVPGDWNTQRPELLYYEGPIWYRRVFPLSPEAGRRYFVHFGAANHTAHVFLNGEPVGRHEGGFTPFSFEVTDRVRSGDNTLVVLVDNTRRREAVPTLMTDWWNYGGITRPVRLLDLPATFVREYHLQLEPGSRNAIRGWVRLDGPRAEQSIRIEIPGAGIEHRAGTDAEGRAELRFEAELELWSPDQPTLHEVRIAAETDAVSEAIGFRSLEVRGTEILLNGAPIFLRGVSAHEEAPFRGGRAWSSEDAVTLLGWVKELRGNFIRLAHYPHNETIVRAADRMGLLVWAEVPVYWTIDWDDERTLAAARAQLAELIGRDRNRAAVALWSVANETPIGDARNEFLATLIGDVRRLDATRFVTAALQARYADETTVVIDDPIGALLDVMGNNEYIGWYDGPPEKCDGIGWQTPYDKPLIMSEFGAGALAGRRGSADQRWTEEYQESVYRRQLAMLARIPFLRGTTPWILMDFRSPRRPLPVVQDGWNRKGLVSERGVRKKAFYVLQEWYEERAREGAEPGR